MEDSPLTPTNNSEVCTPLLYVLCDRVETALGEQHLSKQQVCIRQVHNYNAQKPDTKEFNPPIYRNLKNRTGCKSPTRLLLQRGDVC